MSKEDDLIRQLAKKYGISVAQAREAVRLQDKFVAHVIRNEVNREEGYFPSVRLPGFGLFYCPEVLRRKFTEHNQKK